MDGAWSDLNNLLRRVDFWNVSGAGAIAPGGFWDLDLQGKQRQHQHSSVPLAVSAVSFIMTRPSMAGLDEEPPIVDQYLLLRSGMFRFTLLYPQPQHHCSPDMHCHSTSVLKLGTLVIHNIMLEWR